MGRPPGVTGLPSIGLKSPLSNAPCFYICSSRCLVRAVKSSASCAASAKNVFQLALVLREFAFTFTAACAAVAKKSFQFFRVLSELAFTFTAACAAVAKKSFQFFWVLSELAFTFTAACAAVAKKSFQFFCVLRERARRSTATSAASWKNLTQFLPILYVRISCGGRAGVCCPVPASPGLVILSSARIFASKDIRSRRPAFSASVACTYSRAAVAASSVSNAAALKAAAACCTMLVRLFIVLGIPPSLKVLMSLLRRSTLFYVSLIASESSLSCRAPFTASWISAT